MMLHSAITYAEHYADGETHTNIIGGFCSIIEGTCYSSHHHYNRKYMPPRATK